MTDVVWWLGWKRLDGGEAKAAQLPMDVTKLSMEELDTLATFCAETAHLMMMTGACAQNELDLRERRLIEDLEA